MRILNFPSQKSISFLGVLREEDPDSNITELVVQLMSDAEAELSLREASYPNTLVLSNQSGSPSEKPDSEDSR